MVEIAVPLLVQPAVLRRTQGRQIREHQFQIMPTVDYDPSLEQWAFIPGTIVECVDTIDAGLSLLIARKRVYLNEPIRDTKYLILATLAKFNHPVGWYSIATSLSRQGIIINHNLVQLLNNLARIDGSVHFTNDNGEIHYYLTEKGEQYIRNPRLAIRLSPDYYCHPLWHDDGMEVGDIDPAEFPLSQQLIAALNAWSDEFDAILNIHDPYLTGFKSHEAEQCFKQHGYRLQQRLQTELGDAYLVRYAG